MPSPDLPANRQQRFPAGALLAVLFALPWLLATHVAPWANFHSDALMALAGIAFAAVTLASNGGGRWRASALGLGAAALALAPLVQAAAGLVGYAAEAIVAALFIAGFALAVVSGFNAEAADPGHAAEPLLAGLAIAAIASVGLQFVQWLDLDGLGVLVLQLPERGRPFANLGQPNLLATLLVWGLIAIWWAYDGARIGAKGAVLAAAYLLLGLGMTQSRTGALEMALLVVAAWAGRGALVRPLPARALLALATWFLLVSVAWPLYGATLGAEPALGLAQLGATGKRPDIWRLALDAIAARPWFGWGWNQGTAAHVALATAHPGIGILVPYMHNLVLDLLLWNGIPLGVAVVAGLGAWFLLRWRDTARPGRGRLVLLAVATFGVHALLELPHGHALFLLPVGLMMGIVDARCGARSAAALPRWVVAALLAGATLALATLASEHQAVERDLLAQRMHAAHIANLPPLGAAPGTLLMAPYGELLASLRLTPAPGMPEADLELLRRMAHRFPSAGNLFRLARAEALNGHPEAARAALELLCSLGPPASCAQVARHWLDLARGEQPELAAVEPPMAASRGASGSM